MPRRERPPAECHPSLPHFARGMCSSCYGRWMREQDPEKAKRRRLNAKPAECHPEKPMLARGLCQTCYRREWRLANPGVEWERQNIAQKKKYAESEGYRRRMILRRYGLTPEQYDAMLAEQDGRCAVCRCTSSRRLHVDHCHETGRVRGLLCFNCNSALGHAKDDTQRLQALIRYLEQS